MSKHDIKFVPRNPIRRFLVETVEFNIPIGFGKEIHAVVTNALLGVIVVPLTLAALFAIH